ncbi:MAG: ATP-binding cassette domain-containing protein [Spirochaetota bacterium]
MDRATVVKDGVEILRELSLVMHEDEHVCILGPNGSGKSTIVSLIAGDQYALWRPRAPVRLFGEENWKLFELRARLGLVSDRLQTEHSRDETVGDVLLSAFFGSVGLPLRVRVLPEMREKAADVASFLGIAGLVDRRTSTLSSGEMRRVLVGRALVHDPGMLLLDEPFTSLDIAARQGFTRLLRALASRGHTILLVTHDLAEIPPEIERIVLIKEGAIFADGPKTDVLNSEIISRLYGIEVRVRREDGRYRTEVD